MLESVNDKDINARLECCLVGRTMRTCLLAQDQSCPNCGKKGKQLALILHDTRRQEFGSRCLCNVKNERRRRTSPLYHGDCFSVLRWLYYFLILWLAVLPSFSEFFGSNAFLNPVAGCRPGRHPGYPRLEPRKIVPMTFRQHVPNVSEKTIGASGPTEGKITRDSKRFREELITNLNPNIVFKDEEQTNADRMMTERCRDRLNRLAMMVSEYWKNQVKLRVTEAWDEDGGQREGHSLHYEGRAVDITTTDRDRSKYGMLARLAVEAGFDWVHYESKSHIHCSVKADKSDAARYGGCFSGDSYVFRPSGERIKMSELSVGDEVLSVQTDGRVVRDRVLTFMDRKPGEGGSRSFPFKSIRTHSGRTITLTSNHLIKTLSARDVKFFYPNTDTSGTYLRARFTYARSVRVGDYIFETRTQRNITELIGVNLRLSRVTSVQEISSDHGAYAPLTARGTILTNGVWTSCYAVLENHDVAHFVMSPMRYFYTIYHWFSEKTGSLPDISLREGVSWYPRFLYYTGSIILPESFLYV